MLSTVGVAPHETVCKEDGVGTEGRGVYVEVSLTLFSSIPIP